MEKINVRFTSNKITFDNGALQRILLWGYFVMSIVEPYLNGLLGRITKYYIFVLMFFLSLINKKLKLNAFHAAFVSWLGFKFLSLLWAEDFSTPQSHWVSQLGMVAFLCVLIAVDLDHKTLSALKTTYFISSGVLGVLTLFFQNLITVLYHLAKCWSLEELRLIRIIWQHFC